MTLVIRWFLFQVAVIEIDLNWIVKKILIATMVNIVQKI